MFRTMGFNSSKGSLTTTYDMNMSMALISRDLKEEKIIHQMMKDTESKKLASHLTNLAQDEAIANMYFTTL